MMRRSSRRRVVLFLALATAPHLALPAWSQDGTAREPRPRDSGTRETAADLLLRFLRSLAASEEEEPQAKKADDKDKVDTPAFLQGLEALVAGYPPEQQGNFKLFKAKCSTCHNLAKSLATTDDDWATVVKTMQRKKQSGISPADRQPLTAFLEYWSAHKGAAAPPEQAAGKAAAAAEAPVKKKKEKFPTWSVHGAAFLDYNTLLPRSDGKDSTGQRVDENEGISADFELGGTIALNSKISASVRLCWGCHQLELDQAVGEYRFSEYLSVKAGRFPVPFGAYSQRYLGSVRDSPSQPLPYIMGYMPYSKEFNLGVLPAPYTDNGAVLSASTWPSNDLELDLEIYVVRGLKGGNSDFDYVVSRQFNDNNGEPAYGGRLTLTWGPLALGASAMQGRYDSADTLLYQIVGADGRWTLGEFNVRGEILRRYTQFNIGGPGTGTPKDTYTKDGYYLELDGPVPIVDGLRFFLYQDGLRVHGIFLDTGGPTPIPTATSTGNSTYILRAVAGLDYSPIQGFSIKASGERWKFSDFKDTTVVHLAVVFMF